MTTPVRIAPPRAPQSSTFDAVTVITIYLVVLMGIPSDRRIAGLDGAGSPAALLAIGGLLWWGWYRLQSPAGSRKIGPVSVATLFFVASVLASYVASATLALPVTDRSAADLGMVRLASMVGIVLVANAGIHSWDRFLVLMRRMGLFGGIYACLGLAQFFTGNSFVDALVIPGLSSDSTVAFGERAGFVRALATATHPLESAVILVMLLPIALTTALSDKELGPVRRWFPPLAITLLATLSVTRSALLGVALVFLILFPTWQRHVRHWMGIALGFGLIGVYVAVPGMAGTIIGMFAGGDSSIDSRTDTYTTAFAFVEVSPVFGRGMGTFLPSYLILDNQFLLHLIETGFVGLVALLGLIIAACWSVIRVRKFMSDRVRPYGWALLASVFGGSLLLAFFDAFSFPQACGMFFLMIGLCGSYGNMSDSEKRKRQQDPTGAGALRTGPGKGAAR